MTMQFTYTQLFRNLASKEKHLFGAFFGAF